MTCTAIPGLDLFTAAAPCKCVDCLTERFDVVPSDRTIRTAKRARLDRIERKHTHRHNRTNGDKPKATR